MALVDLLVFHQNEFLERYKRLPGALVNETSLINIKDADLITYTTSDDLSPLVYTHCDYSLELGKGTKIDYNLDKVFQHLTDKIFYGKSIVNFEMKEFVYRDDVHSARKFTNLKNKLEQVNLSNVAILYFFFLSIKINSAFFYGLSFTIHNCLWYVYFYRSLKRS